MSIYLAKPLIFCAGVCLALAAVLHTLQLISLGPWAPQWPILGTWPSGFHLWVVETTLLLLALAIYCVEFFRSRWEPWVVDTAAPRAAALASALAAAQVLLALAFWLTRDKGIDQLGWLRAAFWVDGEFRVPTFFAVLQAWLASWLAWQCGKREPAKVWTAAALVCLYIGVDELLSIHEFVNVQLRGSGWLEVGANNTLQVIGSVRTYPWKLVFLPIAALVGLWILRGFLRVLEGPSVALLVLAALTFLAGAVGFETVHASKSAADPNWSGSAAGHLNLLLEETLETAGMTIAVYVFAKTLWSKAPPAADVSTVAHPQEVR